MKKVLFMQLFSCYDNIINERICQVDKAKKYNEGEGLMYDSNVKTVTREAHDVIVVGGGIAGVAAAVSAARDGASVLLMEKQVNLGGLATGGLISWYEPLCDSRGNQIVFGIAEELIRLSVKDCFDSLPLSWGGTEKSAPRRERYSTRYSPTVFAIALDEYVTESGAEILFDTYGTYPVMEGNLCRGIITENIDGRSFYPAKVVIDATGNAAIMHRAGVPCREGSNYLTYLIHDLNFERAATVLAENKTWAVRNWFNTGANMFGEGQPEGVDRISGLTAKEITEYMLIGKRRMLKRLRERDRYSYDVMSIPTMPQFRTIRQIVGDSDFKAINGNSVPDSIGHTGDFRMAEKYVANVYDMPLSALYNSDFPNLLAAGRIISAPDHDDWEVSRVIPSCAMTGEAAGKAAVRYIKNGTFKFEI